VSQSSSRGEPDHVSENADWIGETVATVRIWAETEVEASIKREISEDQA